MLHPLTLTVPIQDGKLHFTLAQEERLHSFLAPFEGTSLTLTLGKETPRSHDQNRLLWKVYTYISEETGEDTEDLHNALKAKLLPRQFVAIGEEEIAIPKSTTKLTTAEFSTYLTKVIAFAGEQGIAIPFPGDVS